MGIGSMKGGLIPLHIGGAGAGGSGRPGGLSLVTAAPAYPMVSFEDFFRYSSGATGQYVETAIAGTNAVGLSGNSTTQGLIGYLSATTGGTSGDGVIIDPYGKAAQSDLAASTTAAWTFATKFGLGATRTTCIQAVGMIASSIAAGTDWITDPDTTLAGTNSIIIHRLADGVGYSGDPDGDVVLRVYTDVPASSSLVLVANASLSASPIKFELARDAGLAGQPIKAYVNGVLVGTAACAPASGFSARFSMGIKTTTAGTRNLLVDYLFLEQALSAAR